MAVAVYPSRRHAFIAQVEAAESHLAPDVGSGLEEYHGAGLLAGGDVEPAVAVVVGQMNIFAPVTNAADGVFDPLAAGGWVSGGAGVLEPAQFAAAVAVGHDDV